MSHRLCKRLICALVLGAAACHHDEPAQERVPVNVSRAPAGSTTALAKGDVRIVDENNAIDLALIGDSVSSGLSESALAKARRETDTAAVTGSGFGASIERMVKSNVQGALGTRISIPLSAVRDVRYENGEIKFEWNGRPPNLGTIESNKKPLMKSFRPDDAARFVSAVRDRKQHGGAY